MVKSMNEQHSLSASSLRIAIWAVVADYQRRFRDSQSQDLQELMPLRLTAVDQEVTEIDLIVVHIEEGAQWVPEQARDFVKYV
jgi:hypothetical protein